MLFKKFLNDFKGLILFFPPPSSTTHPNDANSNSVYSLCVCFSWSVLPGDRFKIICEELKEVGIIWIQCLVAITVLFLLCFVFQQSGANFTIYNYNYHVSQSPKLSFRFRNTSSAYHNKPVMLIHIANRVEFMKAVSFRRRLASFLDYHLIRNKAVLNVFANRTFFTSCGVFLSHYLHVHYFWAVLQNEKRWI